MIQQKIDKTPLDIWVKHKIGSPDEVLARPQITEYQLRKLKESVDWAYRRSPFYHHHLQMIAEQKKFCLKDFMLLPFTTAAHIQENALQMLCVAQGEINRVVTLDTSGTTSKPKRLYFTRDDQELTIDFFQQAMSTFTKTGDKVFILLPGERPGSVSHLLAIALERLGAIPIKQDPNCSLAEILKKLSATQANILVGIPIQALALAKFYETSHQVLPLALTRMLLSTDYVSKAITKEVSRILKCEVFDHYGMTEMGLGVGIECYAHHGYHLREADLYIEVIDPQTGRVLPEGQYGELVFTTLTRRGMPLIRYRSGDLSRLLPERCLCGTALKNLDVIRVRKDQGILLDDHCSLVIADLDEKLLLLPGVVDFIATASPGQEFTLIEIKLMILDNAIIKEKDVCDSLDQISSIHQAVARKRIRIMIEFKKCNDDFIPRVGKRKINVSLC